MTLSRRTSTVRIEGYLPLQPIVEVSWWRDRPGHTKLVPVTVLVRRADLHDLAVAADSASLRELFFSPAYERFGPKPRGPKAAAARIGSVFAGVCLRLSRALRGDPTLGDRVRAHAQRHGREEHLLSARRQGGLRELVAYMLEERWGATFERLGLRQPLEDVEAFAKRYLRRAPRLDTERRARSEEADRIFDLTVSHFDPSYHTRLFSRIVPSGE